MFEISVKSHFSAAHFLKGYPGACANLHGHNWEVEVFVRGRKTDSVGMLLDFKQLKSAVNEVIDKLDHQELNRLPMFARQNPSSENMARYLFRALSGRLASRKVKLHRVQVSESPGALAVYWEKT